MMGAVATAAATVAGSGAVDGPLTIVAERVGAATPVADVVAAVEATLRRPR
jgi:hypothetical protein